MRVSWDYRNPKRGLFASWAEFIRKTARWTHWTTFTFRVPQDERKAKRVLRDWSQALARAVNAHFEVAWVVEKQSGDGFHVHALLALPDGNTLDEQQLQDQLLLQSPAIGLCVIEEYDPDRGAAEYIAKKQECDISIACPRDKKCKRKGCTQGSWPVS